MSSNGVLTLEVTAVTVEAVMSIGNGNRWSRITHRNSMNAFGELQKDIKSS